MRIVYKQRLQFWIDTEDILKTTAPFMFAQMFSIDLFALRIPIAVENNYSCYREVGNILQIKK